jgi:hypothetical protein
VGAAGDEKHMRSHCGETTSDGLAGATTGTGHDGYLRFQCIHHVLLDAAAGWRAFPIVVIVVMCIGVSNTKLNDAP